eukprot:9503995-Pyramimonas_sp.AAC.2
MAFGGANIKSLAWVDVLGCVIYRGSWRRGREYSVILTRARLELHVEFARASPCRQSLRGAPWPQLLGPSCSPSDADHAFGQSGPDFPGPPLRARAETFGGDAPASEVPSGGLEDGRADGGAQLPGRPPGGGQAGRDTGISATSGHKTDARPSGAPSPGRPPPRPEPRWGREKPTTA